MKNIAGANSAVAAPAARASDLWTMHHGDARNTGVFLAGAATAAGHSDRPFLATTITSPPYANLVDYGSENQIGFGQTYGDYLDSCRTLFADLHRWTLDAGSLWVVADTLMERRRDGRPSRLAALPFELAAQAESVGWTLREVIIWRKDRTRPWSHRGKLRNGFEYVLFLVKANHFTFNIDRLRDTRNLKSWWVKYPERHNPWGMTPDNVWEIPIPVQGSWDDSAFRHACPFPSELVDRMVTLSTDEGDVVFDPFAGSGSVIDGAHRAGRHGLGVELNEDFVTRYRQREPAPSSQADEANPISQMTQRLLELRMLKYPKELANQLLRSGFTTEEVRAIAMEVETINYTPARTSYGAVGCSIIVTESLSELERARLSRVASDALTTAPLSKYGIEASVSIHSTAEIVRKFSEQTVSIYTNGRTWYAAAEMPGADLGRWLDGLIENLVVPIISPLHVRQSLEERL